MSYSDDQLRRANRSHYVDTNEVDSYLQKPHHKIRVALATNLLNQELSLAFDDTMRTKINVLDIGASAGQSTTRISSFGYNAIASDAEFLPLRQAKKHVKDCVQFDASGDFPFAYEVFHGIYMGELIEHVFDTRRLLSECHRVLKKQGVLVITTPNLANLQDRIRFIFGKAPRNVNPFHEYLNLHIRPFTYSLLVEVLQDSGFTPIRFLSNHVRWELSKDKWLESRLIARLIPGFGNNLIIAARKL